MALVPCAGTGSRAGAQGPKQYATLIDRPLVAWTLQALLDSGLDAILVVLSPGDEVFERCVAPDLRQRVVVRPCGGDSRAHSVLGGLQALRGLGLQDDDWVLVHDAARCLIQPGAVQTLVRACEDDAVGGLLAAPVPDTLKRADAQGRVEATVPRDRIWAAQTPQMFRLGPLQTALAAAMQAGVAVTDEASAIEWAGGRPRLVEGPADNTKVTYPADFAAAERVLKGRA